MSAEGPALPNAIWAFRRALGRARGGAMEGPRGGHLVHAASVCARACEWAGEPWRASTPRSERAVDGRGPGERVPDGWAAAGLVEGLSTRLSGRPAVTYAVTVTHVLKLTQFLTSCG